MNMEPQTGRVNLSYSKGFQSITIILLIYPYVQFHSDWKSIKNSSKYLLRDSGVYLLNEPFKEIINFLDKTFHKML